MVSVRDQMKNFDVKAAIWSIFLSVTLQAAVHLGIDYSENLRSAKNQLKNSLRQLFQVTQKLITDQTEISGIATIDWHERMWRETTLLTDRAVQFAVAKNHKAKDSGARAGCGADKGPVRRTCHASRGKRQTGRTPELPTLPQWSRCWTTFPMNRPGNTDIFTVLSFLHFSSSASFVQDFLRLKKICLRTDGEPASGVLSQAIKSARNDETQLETTPRNPSPSFRTIERSNRSVEGQIRCTRIAAEKSADKAFGFEDNILVCRLSPAGLGSLRDFTCRLTGSRRISDKQENPTVESWPSLWSRRDGPVTRNAKLDDRATWIGKAERGDQHITVSADGRSVELYKSMRRLPPSHLRHGRGHGVCCETCLYIITHPHSCLNTKAFSLHSVHLCCT